MITIKCKLVAKEDDILDYHTLVFNTLESNAPFGKNYIMTTMFPNWQHRDIEIGEIGYLTYNEVVAGKDCWYDSEQNRMVPYNYSNLIFIKFVKEVDSSKKDIII